MDTLLNLGAIQIIILILSLIGVGFLMYYMYNHIQELSEKIERMDNKVVGDNTANLEERGDIFNEILDEIDDDELEEHQESEEQEEFEEHEEQVVVNKEEKDDFYDESESKIVEIEEEGCIQILKTGKNFGNKCNKKTLENSNYCRIHSKYME